MTPEGEPLLGARRLREVLDARGIRPSKALGQNFVTDPNTIRKIVDVARLSSNDRVLEIGAGAGSLTLGLAAVAQKVIAVELDRHLVPVLQETVGHTSNVEVVHGDALEIPMDALDVNKLVGNLPYNIATQVVLRALEEAPQIDDLTVMTQREVGERLAAGPGSKTYGQTSVMVAFFASAVLAATISRRVFYPVPNVDSVLLRIVRRPVPADVDRALLFSLIRAAFSQRRKNLRNTLASLAGSASNAERVLRAAEIDPELRGETLALDDFMRLSRTFATSR
ncbi:MAG: 16S rRNA (adenine(1518)-N(6)/adenine(1519)-N(6))-dimethyltransferase RsmA [Actinomycetota bacterium]